MKFLLNIVAILLFLSFKSYGMIALFEEKAPIGEFKKNIDSNESCLFQKDNKGRSILINAVCYSRHDVVKLILKSPNFFGVNDLDPITNFSALHISALQGDKKSLMAILEHPESEVDLAMPMLWHTPLHLAAQGGNDACFEYLKSKGGNPESKNFYHESPQEILEKIKLDRIISSTYR